MKTSDLIQILQRSLEQNGDLPVAYENVGSGMADGTTDIRTVRTENTTGDYDVDGLSKGQPYVSIS